MADVEPQPFEQIQRTGWKQNSIGRFWLWLQFPLLVLILLAGLLWINAQQSQRLLSLSQQQQVTTLQVATDQQHETQLRNYIDTMSNLLVNNKLLQSPVTDTNRLVATAQTLATLRTLDPDRKAQLMSFLYQTKLINNDYHIIDMAGTDLHASHLNGIDIRDTYLVGADLSGAELQKANLSFATLVFTNLSKADLAGADLHGTDLHNANFTAVDLKGANLKDAVGLSNAQIEKATSQLSGTTMPDGTIHQ